MKYIKYLIIVLLVLIKINVNEVNAVSINELKIEGNKEVKKQDYIDLQFKVINSGLKAGNNHTLGIQYVYFVLDYDNKDLQLVSLNSDNFNIELTKIDNKLYVLGTVKEGTGAYMCARNLLYCGDVIVNAKYYINKPSKDMYDIKISNPSIGLLNIDSDRNYTFDDLETIDLENEYIHKIKILNEKNKKSIKPKTLVKLSDNTFLTTNKLNKKVLNNPNRVSIKSDNNYLKSINIDNHEIGFNKDKEFYTINVNDNIDSINIDVETEDSNATYKITGNNNFKDNDNKINIIVTSESGKERIYTIDIKIKESSNNIIVEEKKDNKDKSNSIVGYAKIGGISLIALIIIIFIVGKIKDKKINKYLDEI